jgi:hypothetical protein
LADHTISGCLSRNNSGRFFVWYEQVPVTRDEVGFLPAFCEPCAAPLAVGRPFVDGIVDGIALRPSLEENRRRPGPERRPDRFSLVKFDHFRRGALGRAGFGVRANSKARKASPVIRQRGFFPPGRRATFTARNSPRPRSIQPRTV